MHIKFVALLVRDEMGIGLDADGNMYVWSFAFVDLI